MSAQIAEDRAIFRTTKALGAETSVKVEHPVEALQSMTGEAGVDHAIDTVRVDAVAPQVWRLDKPKPRGNNSNNRCMRFPQINPQNDN
ncbi:MULTISPECIES: hypothetical protein [Leptolyngbya]|jgi:hypothetical protein|uniref:Alcohol dehydrogenase GroES domain-containing protein n=2 Tax=Leptolyngbya boryana TaxID=1184 RepID=A0A1Z4JB08_LEPBY|nr:MULTISPECIES: hypothetical protein [Leptolyngbya]BAY53936.1 alcohol dehydrogenase GroES domain-containing protein [Leptolyngbya boryana NIES-2135]MBD2371553.1 hypothetical protein [Leptolyngbya sp. FACHB-161]MBD2378110.1 hypothetical protein [Leptolyngbya sp. FACHB-238]MBD2402515.1 hypothetical protein [Leptolyngbya sp. FACHB-239]MBD2409009.1 hypothetical protein [Leptolyngbya sp. FACHB-402]